MKLTEEVLADATRGVDPAEVVLGIDFATDRTETAVAALALPDRGRKRLLGVWRPCDHLVLANLLSRRRFAVAAVDVPFGWPTNFIEMVSSHQSGPHSGGTEPGSEQAHEWRVTEVALRHTDRFIKSHYDHRPISVGFDRLGATAAAWSLIEPYLFNEASQRAGCGEGELGRLVETYPTAQMLAWQEWIAFSEEVRSSSKRTPQAIVELMDVFALDVDAQHEELLLADTEAGGHVRDSFVCALIAAVLARDEGKCRPMIDEADFDRAAAEGVIWLNNQKSSLERSHKHRS